MIGFQYREEMIDAVLELARTPTPDGAGMGINLVVAGTDDDWFEMLRQQSNLTEVNFWAPSAANFRLSAAVKCARSSVDGSHQRPNTSRRINWI